MLPPTRSLHLALLVLCIGTPSRLSAQLPSTAQATLDLAAIDRFVERRMREDRVPAAALAIVRGERILHLRGFGTDAQGHPVTGRTAFVLGSMSKPITALAVMQLVDRGEIGLDVPVRQYLPWFRLASPDSGAAVTVRHLLLHTSGIPHGAGRGGGARLSLGDHVAALRDVSPRSAPGTVHAYASPNYLVLGAIVEAASGEPFAAFVEREIFQPLAMHDSFTDRARATEARFAGGHVYALGFPVSSSIPAEPGRLPTAGVMSSAGDLARLLSMQLQGGRFGGRQLLARASVEQMHTGGAPSEGFSYAFGWRDGSIGGTRALHHGGVLPDFRGKMVMLPDSGWGVVVLTNVSSAMPWPLDPTSHRLADDIAAFLAGRPLPTVASRHRALFAFAGILMLVLLALQLRALRRAWAGARAAEATAQPRPAWGANFLDVAFVGFVMLLPRLVGLTWGDLLRGAPDVAGWLLALATLGALTVAVRLFRWHARPAERMA